MLSVAHRLWYEGLGLPTPKTLLVPVDIYPGDICL